MQNIKNIIFDLGGVLVGLDGQRSIHAFDALGCQAISRYIEEHRTEDLFYRIEIGLATTEEFCDEVRQMTGVKVDDAPIIAAWNDLLTAPTTACTTRLMELKAAGYRLFLLSNTNDMHWQHCVNGLLPKEMTTAFDRVFLSYEMRLSKPDPAIFTEVLQTVELEPDETLFVDDNSDNIAAAAQLGIHTFLNTERDLWTTALLQ